MTHPAEITSVWDWQRFEAALTGLRVGVDTLDDFIAGIHDARDTWQDDEERQQWTDIDEQTRRDTELDWASDGHLDGDYTRDVDE
ncbi:hypothetical protein ACIODS_16965 [Micromonospora chalcea]|uniref:Uncharacterized protein n=1 Tax=Micromonospora aurantiaca (nom. illeg.) TaxID=47850 RepID=A0A1C6TN94_9ACTN|nr:MULTISPECIES: hypothetical protein [Micromonospora]AXH93723.1 hypothetical protein DVH21_29590 [Micromonospora aurantiaca]KAB1097551.1 hypothetical protein F6X54_32690 [Micromonospora aurantiaca]MBC9006252.1 hypothetical protein [Micromonospora aurantiaca]MDG4752912.1 hypothetical protein [Micromonospora sp. WMMD718]OHX06871.1 hypothetical protein BFV98_29740 [Micromonospora sp. WMMB235]